MSENSKKTSEIMDMALNRVVEGETSELRKIFKKAAVLKACEDVMQTATILGLEATIECYRAAMDSLELLKSEFGDK